MNIQARVANNVRDQSIVNEQLKHIMDEANKLNQKLSKLTGQMELLSDLYKEEHGKEINDAIAEDDSFQQLLMEARKHGAQIAQGATSPVTPAAQKAEGPIGVVDNKSVGTKHTGNKRLKPKKPEELAPVRTRQPPVIELVDPSEKPDKDEPDED